MWIAITTDNVRGRMSLNEITALEAGGETDAVDNKLQECIDQVTAHVRAKVGSCQRNTLGMRHTIPEECLYAAVSMIRFAVVASIPNFPGGEDAAREREYEEAITFLNSVAECEVNIVAPDAGTTVTVDQFEWDSEEAKLDFAQ